MRKLFASFENNTTITFNWTFTEIDRKWVKYKGKYMSFEFLKNLHKALIYTINSIDLKACALKQLVLYRYCEKSD